ncbi:MAG: S41 family peptidase [Chloroflexota bacterium]
MEHLIRRHRTLAAGLLVVMLLTATACAVGPLAGLFPQAASVPAANPSAASVAPAPAAPSAPSAPATAPRAASKDFALVTEVWNVLQQDYVERNRLDSEKLTQGAVRGMIEALNDPYTAYIDPNSFRVDQESLRGSFEGIGAVVAVREGQIIIVSPFTSSPAEKAGVRPGDAILAINGQSTKGLSLQEAVLKIRGARGTSVKITIRHAGEKESIDLQIVRADVRIETVSLNVPDDKLAVLRITQFNQRTDQEVRAALEEARRKDVKGIILDLRNNPGGLLDVTVNVASQFLKEGLVLYEVDNQGRRTDWPVQPGGLALGLPIVVLANQYSASGSEVLAGALQSAKRATLVGVKTFGKGSVNVIRSLSDGGGLYVTHARWYTPSGNLIEGKGLEPDIEAPLPPGANDATAPRVDAGPDVQLQKAHDVLAQQMGLAR